MEYRKGVFIIVYRESPRKYLLLKRKLHWKGWEFPKGGVEFLETNKGAVKRETKEETGLRVLKIKDYGLSGEYKYDKKTVEDRKKVGQTWRLYSVQVGSGKIKIDKKEHSDYEWVNYNKAIKMLSWSNQRKCLRIVDRDLNDY